VSTATVIAGAVVLATLVEGLVEYFVVPLLVKVKATEYARYVALVVGIGVCIGYGVDILEAILGFTSPVLYLGMVLSGTIVGRGANYVNDFIDYLRSLATPRLR